MTLDADTNTVLLLPKTIVEKNKEANDALGKQDAMKDAERSMTAEGTVAISQWKEEIGT